MALTSGGSFGFFMGIGAIMRSGEAKEKKAEEDFEYKRRTLDPVSGEIKEHAMYREISENEGFPK
mgnify:CR=1 FL=1